jgi:hypothetical protein
MVSPIISASCDEVGAMFRKPMSRRVRPGLCRLRHRIKVIGSAPENNDFRSRNTSFKAAEHRRTPKAAQPVGEAVADLPRGGPIFMPSGGLSAIVPRGDALSVRRCTFIESWSLGVGLSLLSLGNRSIL